MAGKTADNGAIHAPTGAKAFKYNLQLTWQNRHSVDREDGQSKSWLQCSAMSIFSTLLDISRSMRSNADICQETMRRVHPG
jgi:hypothetical protein